jgi:DNA-binding FadR family transcriptional regulator
LPLKAVEPRRLHREIAEQIRGLIDQGEYPVGERLPSERELAESLGVSRPSVREALIVLEVEGSVKIKVGSGIYVLEPSQRRPKFEREDSARERPLEVLHAREVVEASIAAEAATLAHRDHIGIIDDVIARMERCSGRHSTWIALDREFHISIAAVLGNSVLTHLVEDLFNKRMSPYFERLASYFEDDSTWRQALAEHKAVRDAINAGDPETARRAMRMHLNLSRSRFSRGFGETPRPPYVMGENEPQASNLTGKQPISHAQKRRRS